MAGAGVIGADITKAGDQELSHSRYRKGIKNNKKPG
jgi:hypothetical protein